MFWSSAAVHRVRRVRRGSPRRPGTPGTQAARPGPRLNAPLHTRADARTYAMSERETMDGRPMRHA